MVQRRAAGAPIAGTVVLDGEAAAKLAAGITEAKLVTIREVLAKKGDIAAMKAEDVEKLARLTEANAAMGQCGLGCW